MAIIPIDQLEDESTETKSGVISIEDLPGDKKSNVPEEKLDVSGTEGAVQQITKLAGNKSVQESIKSVPAMQSAFATQKTLEFVTDPIQSKIKEFISPVTKPIIDSLSEKKFLEKKKRGFTMLMPALEQGELLLESTSPKQIGMLVEEVFTDPLILIPGAVGTFKKGSKIAFEALPVAKKIAIQASKQAKINAKIDKLGKMVDDITIEITQPSARKLAEARRKGSVLPEVREVSKVIQKSKDFDEMADGIKIAKQEVLNARDALLKNDKKLVLDDYMRGLQQKIDAAKVPGSQVKSSEIAQMEFVLNQEKEFYKAAVQTPGKFQIGIPKTLAQERKIFYQNRTQNIMKKRELGTLTEKEAARVAAEDELRFGLKLGIEEGNAQLKAKNAIAEGLIKAESNVLSLGAAAKLRPTNSIIRQLLNDLHSSIAFSPQMTAARMVGREISGKTTLARKTGKLVKLREKALSLQNKAALLESGIIKLRGVN